MTRSQARAALRAAIDRCGAARGEAQWWNGYRLGTGDDPSAMKKELECWSVCTQMEAQLERFITAYGTACKKASTR